MSKINHANHRNHRSEPDHTGEPDEEDLYLCFYCGSETSLRELDKVTDDSMELDEEDYEFLQDVLPYSEKPMERPYTRASDRGYDVLNICRKCYNKANGSLNG